ncbi:MAG: DUF434 domain-containing protein [Clostridiales bacterium]|nr:DUF434 domain-containing protein [Clostridiales bacterium]
MEEKSPRRGYAETDERDFSLGSLNALRKAQEEIHWLLDRGYPIGNAATFVCNRYLFSARQRIALTRATAQTGLIEQRKAKEVSDCKGEVVSIDGLNLIITLEVALSGSVLIKCMDGTVRDLAGLRGTYRLIDKTDAAIALIGDKLKSMGVAGADFYLDAPVSNTGRLKVRMLELLAGYGYGVRVELVKNVDAVLKAKPCVATSDGGILDECTSWTNMASALISESVSCAKLVDLA